MPRTQIGRALEDALARETNGWAGLTTRIVRHHAEQVAQPRILASGRSELPVGGRSFLAARLLQQLQRRGRLDGLPGPQRLAETVAEAIETLRRNGAPLAEVQERAEAEAASATFRVVAACYEGYLEALDTNHLYDDAHVFQWATELVRGGAFPAVGTSVVAVCDAVDLPVEAHQFLSAVRSGARAFYRIGRSRLGAPPPQTAAARFGDVAPPSTGETDGAVPPVHVRRAVGSGKEVDAVVRDLLNAEVPLDEVE
ncbi:MAG: PD-(D/E)XK nuclease family protein, partial [Salinibacter sp.]